MLPTLCRSDWVQIQSFSWISMHSWELVHLCNQLWTQHTGREREQGEGKQKCSSENSDGLAGWLAEFTRCDASDTEKSVKLPLQISVKKTRDTVSILSNNNTHKTNANKNLSCSRFHFGKWVFPRSSSAFFTFSSRMFFQPQRMWWDLYICCIDSTVLMLSHICICKRMCMHRQIDRYRQREMWKMVSVHMLIRSVCAFLEHVCEQETLVSIRHSNPTCWVIVVAVVVVAAAVVVDVGCPLSLPSLLLSPLWRVLATTAFRYHIHKYTHKRTHNFSCCVWKWTFSCYRETFVYDEYMHVQ